MEMDISDMFTEVQLGKPDPLDKLMTVKDRANTYSKSGNQIVGAINANFYEMNKKRPVHLISEENRLVYAGYISADSPFVRSPLAFGRAPGWSSPRSSCPDATGIRGAGRRRRRRRRPAVRTV